MPSSRGTRRWPRARGLWVLLLVGCSSASGPGTTTGTVDAGAGDAGPSNRQPGMACAASSDCASQFCLGGHCCSEACQFDLNHPECATCDSQGTCQYPTAECQVATGCTPGATQYIGAAQCQNGSCGTPQLQSCAPYLCAPTGCKSSCRDDSDCATGSFCKFSLNPNEPSASPDGGAVGTCVAQSLGGGFCGHDDECQSATCLKNVCCATTCTVDPANPECSSCDPLTGACLYPATVCRGGGCSSQNDFNPPTQCSQGACPAASTVSCGSYLCTPQGCDTECLTDRDCASSAFCLYPGEGVPGQQFGLQQGSCCPAFEDGKPIYVDVASGNDTVCCGYDRQHPCQSVERVTTLWNSFLQNPDRPATTLTLELSVDGGAGTWLLPPQYLSEYNGPELWSTGMTVHAPGVSFLNGINISPTVTAWAAGQGPVAGTQAPSSPATVKGDIGNPVFASVSAGTPYYPLPPPVIVNLANVIGGGAVGANAEFNLAVDDQGHYGPVSGNFSASGIRYAIIECYSSYSNADRRPDSGQECIDLGWLIANTETCVPALITDEDVPGDGGSVYAPSSLSLGDCATVNLTHGPALGGAGEGVAVAASLASAVHLANGSIQATSMAGLQTGGSTTICGLVCNPDNPCPPAACINTGTPSVVLDNMSITNNGCFGIQAQGGSVFLNRTTVANNYIGVDQDTANGETGLVVFDTLPDGGAAFGNQVFCDSEQYASASCPNLSWHMPGIDIWNTSAQPLHADNVAWSQIRPELWTCDVNADLSSCVAGDNQKATGVALNLVRSPAALGAPVSNITYSQPGLAAGANCP